MNLEIFSSRFSFQSSVKIRTGGEGGGLYIFDSADPCFPLQSQISLKFWKEDLMVNTIKFTEADVKVKDMTYFRKYKVNWNINIMYYFTL